MIIPVRNRERTVADAVKSALAQKAGFEFNVIVVDNHSTDATGEIVESLAAEDSRVVHIVPENEGHGIGAGISGYATQGVAAMPCSSTVMTYTKMKRFCRRLWINSGMSGAPW